MPISAQSGGTKPSAIGFSRVNQARAEIYAECKRLGYELMAASLMAAPGVILSLTSRADGFAGSNLLGNLLLGLGVPMAATFADKMFRRPTARELGSR